MNRELSIVDGNNVAQALFSEDYPDISDRFLRELESTKALFDSQEVVVCFDHPEASGSRRELYEEYKSKRKTDDRRKAAVRQAVLASKEHYLTWFDENYEADDLIASLCHRYAHLGIVVRSTDHDLMALLSNELIVQLASSPRRADQEPELYTRKYVESRYGIKIEQFDEYRALVGDSSDTLPGVSRIGPKTAVEILTQFSTVQEAVEHSSMLQLAAHRKRALVEGYRNGEFELAKELTVLRTDAEPPEHILNRLNQLHLELPQGINTDIFESML